MNSLGNPMEISEEERRRRLGRVYAILIAAAERQQARMAKQNVAATLSGADEGEHGT